MDGPREGLPAGAAHSRAVMMLAVAALLALAAAVRFQGLGRLEMWSDECHSVLTVMSPHGVFAELKNDSNAPLYFLLLRGWLYVIDSGEAAPVRALSALLGVGAVAMYGLWAVALRLGRAVALWALGLGALATLQVYYSQEARGYTLCFLLVAASGAALAAAIRRGGWWLWLLHGVTLGLACYSHDLCVAFFAAAWLGAVILGARGMQWAALAGVHVAAAAAYAPQLLRVMGQPKGPALAWIKPLWESIPPALAIPRSLEVLGLGATTPGYIRLATPDAEVRWLALAWLAVCAVGIVLAWRRAADDWETKGDDGRRAIAFLAVWALVPMLAQFVYSFVVMPIYVVGRYDTLGQPAYLVLMAMGAWEMQRRLMARSRLAGAVMPVAIVGALAAANLLERTVPLKDDLKYRPMEVRGRLLSKHARRTDLIVCFGLEGVKIGYQTGLRKVQSGLATFPPATQNHLGWFDPMEALEQGEEALRLQARLTTRGMVGPGKKYRRMWVAVDPYYTREAPPGGRNPYAELAAIFFDEARASTLAQVDLPTAEETWRAEKVGLMLFVPTE